MIKVAVNGFGRIGRSAFKVAIEKHSDKIEIVAINDLTSPEVLAHLLKYDSAYGIWNHEVKSSANSIIVDQKSYTVYQEKEPVNLPWKDLNVDVVIESTGRFTSAEGLKQHLAAGAKKVVLSAPARNASHSDAGGPAKPASPPGRASRGGGEGGETFLIGGNARDYKGEQLVNNASCTTNCIAPVVSIIDKVFGIEKAVMTTVHGVTAEQNLVDGPPPGGKANDLRRARAAYVNIIPTTTGAAVATTEAIPDLKGKFDGVALRVPVICGSISDFTFLFAKSTTIEEVNAAMEAASKETPLKGILAVSKEPLVSSDIVGRSESAIVDLSLTQVVDGDMVKVFAWYDNEWGYSNRLIEQVIQVGAGSIQ